jgi:hypothetical protein
VEAKGKYARQNISFVAEPPVGIEPMTYALRAGSRALLAGSTLVPASGHRLPLVTTVGVHSRVLRAWLT